MSTEIENTAEDTALSAEVVEKPVEETVDKKAVDEESLYPPQLNSILQEEDKQYSDTEVDANNLLAEDNNDPSAASDASDDDDENVQLRHTEAQSMLIVAVVLGALCCAMSLASFAFGAAATTTPHAAMAAKCKAPPPVTVFFPHKWMLDAEEAEARTQARALYTQICAQMACDEVHLSATGCLTMPFGPWSQCSADNVQTRHRLVDDSPSFGGKACPNVREQRQCMADANTDADADIDADGNTVPAMNQSFADAKFTCFSPLAKRGFAGQLTCAAFLS